MVTQELRAIASIRSDFHEKFGIPRQSGLIHQMISTVVFEPEYRNPDAFREIEGFSHLWLIWQFSKALREDWSPTVRPPRLGGNTRIGVFASRSPFRPNPLGLSCVKLERYRVDPVLGPVLEISGADLMIVAGTSLSVEPAASLIENFSGRDLVVINKEATPADERATLVIRDDVASVFAALEKRL